MKKRLTRIVSLLLSLLLVLSLAACASNGEPTEKPQKPAAEAETPKEETTAEKEKETPASEPVHLKWYLGGNAPQPDQETVSNAMEAYILENYGLNLDLELVVTDFGSYSDKAQMVIASSEEYDIMWTSGWCNNYWTNVSKNAFMPMDDLLAEYGKEFYESIPAGIWDACRVNGVLYAAPSYQIECSANCVAIPVKYVEEFNLDVDSIEDLIDLNDFFYDVKEAYPDMYPLCVAGANNSQLMQLCYDVGYEALANTKIAGALDLNSDELKVVNQFELESYQTWCKYFYQWNQDGIIRMDAATVQESGIPDTKAGMHAAYTDTSWKPYCEETYYDFFGGQECVVIRLSDPYCTTSNPNATLNAISNTCKNPEVAMQFLNILNTDATLFNMLCFGLEGVHYTLDENGLVVSNDAAGYNPNCDWVFGNQFNATPRTGQQVDIWEKTKELTDSAKISIAMGFSFDTTPVANEIAACTTVFDQYITPIVLGSVDPETAWPEAMEKLEGAGYQTIIDQIQKQLDDWAANNR